MKKSKGMAIASFLFGLTFWIPLINVLFSPFALFLGIKALKKIKMEPEKNGGKAFAIIGIVLGIITVLFFLTGIGYCLSGYKEICRAMGLTLLY